MLIGLRLGLKVLLIPAEEWEDMDGDDDDDDDDMEWGECEEEVTDAAGSTAPGVSSELPPGVIPVTECLFCSHHSRTLLKNVDHMTKVHSFFIPDVEYLADLRGLLRYLGEYRHSLHHHGCRCCSAASKPRSLFLLCIGQYVLWTRDAGIYQ